VLLAVFMGSILVVWAVACLIDPVRPLTLRGGSSTRNDPHGRRRHSAVEIPGVAAFSLVSLALDVAFIAAAVAMMTTMSRPAAASDSTDSRVFRP
jgi:hypothetical protein